MTVRIEPLLPEYVLWVTGHPINDSVMKSVGEGLKDPMRHTVFYDGVTRPSVSYGILRGTQKIFNDCYDKGIEYFELDRGYLKPSHFDGYYRVSLNNMQATYRDINAPSNRFKALNIKLKPWQPKKNGRILVVPPTDAVCSFYKIDEAKWLSDTLEKLSSFTVKVRKKTDEQPLYDDIDYSDCIITYNSNVAIDALIRGVPAIATSHNSIIKNWNNLDFQDLGDYVKLISFDRDKLFNFMTYCQWTLEELSKPATWRLIRDIQKGF